MGKIPLWKRGLIAALLILLCVLLAAPLVLAQDESPTNPAENETPIPLVQDETPVESTEGVSAEFTDPLTALPQLSLQDVYTPLFYDSEAQTNRLIGRIIIPRVPETSLLPVAQLIRPTFTVVTHSSGDGSPTRTAFGDMILFDLFVSPWPKRDSGFMMALGPVFVFPTATEEFAGQNAWQLGPAFGAICKKIPRMLVGGLIQNSFSFAYTSPDHQAINVLIVQPIIAYYLGRGFYVKSADASFKFEWADGGAKVVPVSLGLGYVMRRKGWPPFNVFVSGEHTVYRENIRTAPETTVRFGLTVAFPQWSLW